MNSLFVTGTDTGVGKTYVVALLARLLIQQNRSVGVIKPYATGCVEDRQGQMISEDATFLRDFVPLNQPYHEITPICYEPPLAPYSAELETGRHYSINSAKKAIESMKARFEVTLVEGIGGAMVPLKLGYYVSHLIRDLQLATLVVVRPNLGTLNHTLLTLDHLRRLKVKVIGLVINHSEPISDDPSLRTNARVLREETQLPIVAEVRLGDQGINLNVSIEELMVS